MTATTRLRRPALWICVLVTLAASACGGGSARSDDDAGSDTGDNMVDGRSPNPADVPVAPPDGSRPAKDVPAASDLVPAADRAPIDNGPADVPPADAPSPADATPPADVQVGPAAFDDLIVSGVGLEAFEGMTFYLAIESPVVTVRGSAVVAAGRFVATLSHAFDRDQFGAFVLVYADLNGDGHCTAADVGAWSVFADNRSGRGQPERFEFDPQRESPRFPDDCSHFP